MTATNKYSDLFWALQGGGSSFCLVTRFDLKTFSSPITMISDASYGNAPETKQKWMDSVLNFALNGDKDPKGTIIPVARFGTGFIRPQYDSTLFYNGNSTSPAVLRDFLGGRLSPVLDDPTPLTPKENGTAMGRFSLANYSALVRPAFEPGGESFGLRQKFHVMPTLATPEAMSIVHDTYFAAVQKQLSNVTDFFTGLAYNPMTKTLFKATNTFPGALQGIDEVPAFWVEESGTWGNEADDGLIDEFFHTVNAEILEKLEAANATAKFHYLNDADKGQPVFQSYPAGNLRRLKEIRAKYDPEKVFTNLMPGGFKVEAA